MINTDRERQAPVQISETEPSHLARYTFSLNFIKNTDNVLDIPCGSGYGVSLFSQTVNNVTGIDIYPEAIQHAKEFFQGNNTTFIVGDMEKLESVFNEGQKFDVITSFEGIEHIIEQKKFLGDVSKILKKDGYLIISTPRKPHGNPYHKKELSLEEFEEVLSEQFVVEKMFGQIYTDIFNMSERKENPSDYQRFNFIALCKLK